MNPETSFSLRQHVKANIAIVTGHYGCGKTNLSANMAIALAGEGMHVSVVDLDIVNPYFRISDFTTVLQDAGVRVVAPNFAGTTLDTPSLSPQIQATLEEASRAGADDVVLVDVGGDPDGATALGRYRRFIEAAGYQMIYVVNERRLQTSTPAEALELMREIEQICGLSATHVVGNTHLKDDTTPDTVVSSLPYCQKVAEEASLPLEFVTAPRNLAPDVEKTLAAKAPAVKSGTAKAPAAQSNAGSLNVQSVPAVLPVDIYVKTPWD